MNRQRHDPKHVARGLRVVAIISCGVLATWLALALRQPIAAGSLSPAQQELPLRVAEPLEAIAADLESYIPTYMRQEGIPGASVALIREGQVAWTEGFGVANAFTGTRVAPDTLLEMASNSKVVTAYIALQLVDQGKLSLDEPLNGYLSEPWLPPSEYRELITLRHVLSHDSGLGHNSLSRHSLFAPGQGYSYSAVGFLYLQAVIEEVTGEPLETVAQELVFEPLGMSSSSFVNRADLTARTANGHLRAIVPALLFAILYVACLAVVGLLGRIVLRIRSGRWRPSRRQVVGIRSLAFALSLAAAFVLLGQVELPEFAWLIALCGLVLAAAFASMSFAGRAIILRLSPERPGWQGALTFIWTVLAIAGLALIALQIPNVPVPKWPAVQAGAASSVRATAADMAKFLIELSNPQQLSAELAAQLQTPQVWLSNDLSWGLGPGIQHSRQGDALWQWGQHVDFQSVMIVYPEQGFGVVVLTNSDLLNPDVAIDIAHRALGGKIEPIRRASHLEFNVRPDGG